MPSGITTILKKEASLVRQTTTAKKKLKETAEKKRKKNLFPSGLNRKSGRIEGHHRRQTTATLHAHPRGTLFLYNDTVPMGLALNAAAAEAAAAAMVAAVVATFSRDFFKGQFYAA